jgi:radical SAM-linked protein
MTEDSLTRYRLQFNKDAQLCYIGHLDLHRAMERTLRRAKLPLDYSKGFNPRVKINLSSALPLGCSSIAELADIWLLENLETSDIHQALTAAAPPGLTFNQVAVIDLKTPSLQSQTNAVEYLVRIETTVDQAVLAEAVETLLDQAALPRVRRGKPYDLRPLLHELEFNPFEPLTPALRMVLNAGEGSTGRPEEVLLALGLDPAEMRIQRTQILLNQLPDN